MSDSLRAYNHVLMSGSGMSTFEPGTSGAFAHLTHHAKKRLKTLASQGISQATGIPEPLVASGLNYLDNASSSFQQSTFSGAKRVADEISGAGGGADVDRANVSIPPSALIRGRGLEVGSVTRGFQARSKLNLPKGGALMHNAWAEQLKAWSPVTCKMAFAYKAVLGVVLTQDATPPTRFYTHQYFRHCLSDVNQSTYNSEKVKWNETLGPDSSLTRQVPPAGSAYATAAVTAGYSNSLRTPYRSPINGSNQICRLARPLLENIGWNANPIKLCTIGAPGTSASLNSATAPALTPMNVYANAALQNVDSATGLPSLPSQQPVPMTTGQPEYQATSCYYRSQFGNGQINYQFANDGTGAVVVDVVIHKLKRGNTVGLVDATKTALESVYKQGYLNMCLGNRGVINFDGGAPTGDDVFLNSKVEFMPKKCLKYYNTAGVDSAPHPFVQVARDQFIVESGSVKPYSFNLPALNYDARNYKQPSSGTGNAIDDLTYIVSVAFSTVSVPLIENATSTVSVIDRRGTSLNCSITGTYSETCHPVYLADYNNNFYINGVLNAPYYVAPPPTLSRSNIIPPEAASRATSTTSAYIDIGPSNTISGA